jgi:hypothetical protein
MYIIKSNIVPHLKNYFPPLYYIVYDTYNFDYTETPQYLEAVKNTWYKVELWGANEATNYNYGGYVSGYIYLFENTTLCIYVGQQGYYSTTTTFRSSYNGGGNNSYRTDYSCYSSGGGGATDIRLIDGEWNDDISLNSRLIVASGCGGFAYYRGNISYGGRAGGLIGYSSKHNNTSTTTSDGKGATQISGGEAANSNYGTWQPGSFGYGSGSWHDPNTMSNSSADGGGGGGWYGGSAGFESSVSYYGGGGGSSYISGHIGCVAITSEDNRNPKNGDITETDNFDS